MVLKTNMLERMITIFSLESVMTAISGKVDILTGAMDSYLSNSGNLRTLSIILMMLAIVLFLFLIAVLYVKSLSSFLRAEQNRRKEDEKQSKSFFESMDDDIDAAELEKIRQEELEKELERELEKAVAEKAAREEKEKAQAAQKKKQKEEEKILAVEEKMPELKKRMVARNDNVLDFDWKKGKLKDMENLPEPPDMPLQYQQSQKKLSVLLGLIIDMLGRNVDDLKIAQTVMFRNMNQDSEENILQTIDAVKDFIALCINGKFTPLRGTKTLPDEEKALYNLAMGDSSPALSLLEALMDDHIDRAAVLPAGGKRDEMFAITSNYAVTFGTLAAVADVHLATGAFELAIELHPQNINAWNRIGDMYKLAENETQATKAYQNVLNLADGEMNQRQIANAEKMLSQYYYAQGDSLQAAKLHNSSKGYYDSIGINRRLDRQEVEIVEIIESHQQEELEETIGKILANQNLKQYSFA